MSLPNVHFPVAKNVVTANGTSYLPSSGGRFHNGGFAEMVLYAQRTAETGSGTLTITMEEYDPTCDDWFAVLGGGGSAVGLFAWSADETDTIGASGAAGGRQILRMGSGILGGDADGVLAVNTEDVWVEYTPPQFWRLKVVEAGTTSTITIGCQYRRG